MSTALVVAAAFFLLLGLGWTATGAAFVLSITVVPPALWFLALQRAHLIGLRPLDLFMRYVVMTAFLVWMLHGVTRRNSTRLCRVTHDPGNEPQ